MFCFFIGKKIFNVKISLFKKDFVLVVVYIRIYGIVVFLVKMCMFFFGVKLMMIKLGKFVGIIEEFLFFVLFDNDFLLGI